MQNTQQNFGNFNNNENNIESQSVYNNNNNNNQKNDTGFKTFYSHKKQNSLYNTPQIGKNSYLSSQQESGQNLEKRDSGTNHQFLNFNSIKNDTPKTLKFTKRKSSHTCQELDQKYLQEQQDSCIDSSIYTDNNVSKQDDSQIWNRKNIFRQTLSNIDTFVPIKHDLRNIFQKTNMTNTNRKRETHLSRIQSPLTYKVENFQEKNKKYQKNQASNGEVQRKINYYQNFKQADRIQDKNQIFKVKNSLDIQLLQPTIKNKCIMPKTFGIDINLKKDNFITTLSLKDYNIEPRYLPILENALKHETMNHLQILDFINNNIKGKKNIVKQLVKCLPESIEKVNFNDNQMGNIEIQDILPLFDKNQYHRLSHLYLSNNKLTDTGIQNILVQIEKHANIQVLDLSNNFLTDVSMKIIGEIIDSSCYITELYLNWNNIGQQGCSLIAKGLSKNQQLAVLDLSHNKMGGFDKKSEKIQAGVELIEVITNRYSGLKHIDLSYNNFSKIEGEKMALLLQGDKSIYGFHFEGNSNGYIDQRQFIQFQENITEQPSVNMMFKKKIQGVKPVLLNTPIQTIDQTNYAKGDICWICQGWSQLYFVYKRDKKSTKKDVFLHLSFENYEGFLLEDCDKEGNPHIYRMCPPNQKIRYFFTFLDHYQPEINKEVTHEDNKLSHAKGQEKQLNILYPGGIYKKMHQPRYFNYQITPENSIVVDDKTYLQKVQAVPRPNGIIPEIKIIKWDFATSIFFEWKRETKKNVDDCFETDYQNSKISRLTKVEEDNENLKILLRKHYEEIRYIYKYFSSIYLQSDLYSISQNTFTDFVQHIPNIFDNQTLQLKDLDINFIGANQIQQKYPLKPERCLVRFNFMEILVRLASDKYYKTKQVSTITEAFQQMIDDSLSKVFERVENTQEWRDQRYWNEECDMVLKENVEFLQQLYDKYAWSKKEKHKKYYKTKFMSNYEFKDMWNHFDLYDGLFCDRDPLYFFNISIQYQVDELVQERFMHMNFVEFIEAFSRVAEKLSPVGEVEEEELWTIEEKIWQPLDIKIKNLISIVKPKFQSFLDNQKQVSHVEDLNTSLDRKEMDSQDQQEEEDYDQQYQQKPLSSKNLIEDFNEDTYDKIYRAYANTQGVYKSFSVQNIIKQEEDEKNGVQQGNIQEQSLAQLKNQKSKKKTLQFSNQLRKFLINNKNTSNVTKSAKSSFLSLLNGKRQEKKEQLDDNNNSSSNNNNNQQQSKSAKSSFLSIMKQKK